MALDETNDTTTPGQPEDDERLLLEIRDEKLQDLLTEAFWGDPVPDEAKYDGLREWLLALPSADESGGVCWLIRELLDLAYDYLTAVAQDDGGLFDHNEFVGHRSLLRERLVMALHLWVWEQPLDPASR